MKGLEKEWKFNRQVEITVPACAELLLIASPTTVRKMLQDVGIEHIHKSYTKSLITMEEAKNLIKIATASWLKIIWWRAKELIWK